MLIIIFASEQFKVCFRMHVFFLILYSTLKDDHVCLRCKEKIDGIEEFIINITT